MKNSGKDVFICNFQNRYLLNYNAVNFMTDEEHKNSETTLTSYVSVAFKIAVAAIFAALVAVATLLFWIPIPATSGYFNLGETLIYVAALLFGPFVGAIAGTGATIADALVAAQYAPGTFTIKAIEGFLVGFLYKKLVHKTKSITLSATIAIIVGGFEMVLGYFLYETLILGSYRGDTGSSLQHCSNANRLNHRCTSHACGLACFPTA